MGELVVSVSPDVFPDGEARTRGLINRIKGLPVDLINRVLLQLMKKKLLKDFVKTTAFCQPWRTIQSDILNLEALDLREISLIKDGSLSSFCSFMDWLIECYPSGKRLNGFSLKVQFPWDCGNEPAASITKWIRFASKHDPEYISLDQRHYRMPRFMYSLYGLKSLHLANCRFQSGRKRRIDWPHLKELSAHGVWMGGNILPDILSGSPALQLLELKDCEGLLKVDLEKSRVNKLVIDSPSGELEIIAPNLLVLCLRGCGTSFVKPLKLRRLHSLVEVELNFFRSEFAGAFFNYFIESSSLDNLKMIHDELRHVSTLHIDYRGDGVVASLKNNGYDLQDLTKCKNLITGYRRDGINLLGFTTLLERSPNLNKLEDRMSGINDEYKLNPRKRKLGCCWNQNDEYKSLVKNLKHVKLLVVSWPDVGTRRSRTRTFDLENGGEEMVRSVAQYLILRS